MRFEFALSGTVTLNVNLSQADPATLALLRDIRDRVTSVQTRETSIMATLADVQTQLTTETNAGNAMMTLLQTVKSDLDAAIASNDPTALQAISDSLGANTTAWTAATLANTPAAAQAPATA